MNAFDFNVKREQSANGLLVLCAPHTIFIMPPGRTVSVLVNTKLQKNGQRTDSNVGPVDTLLTWFFLNCHCTESENEEKGKEEFGQSLVEFSQSEQIISLY